MPIPVPTPAEIVAQAFHETYERLAPSHGYETREASAKPWWDIPAQNRDLMVAVAQNLLDRGVIARRPRVPQALPDDMLYVVTTGLPGPGTAALIDEALGDPLNVDPGVRRLVLETAAKGCEFVELEDARGRSHGDDVGVRWETESPFVGPERAKLGPFAPPEAYARAAEAARALAAEIVKLDARDPVDEGADGYQEVDNVEAWPSVEAVEVALRVQAGAR